MGIYVNLDTLFVICLKNVRMPQAILSGSPMASTPYNVREVNMRAVNESNIASLCCAVILLAAGSAFACPLQAQDNSRGNPALAWVTAGELTSCLVCSSVTPSLIRATARPPPLVLLDSGLGSCGIHRSVPAG